MSRTEYDTAHARAIRAAERNGLRSWLPVWFWPAFVLISAVAFGASFNIPDTLPCVDVCEFRSPVFLPR